MLNQIKGLTVLSNNVINSLYCLFVEVCGAYPDILTKTAQAVMENTDVDFMDINCGCPIDLFYRKVCA